MLGGVFLLYIRPVEHIVPHVMLDFDVVSESFIAFRALVQFLHIYAAHETDVFLVVDPISQLFAEVTKGVNDNALYHIQ